MKTPAPNSPVALDLSREERWVAHHAVLAEIERILESGDHAEEERELLAKLEANADDYGPEELQRLRDCLQTYLTDAPRRDLAPGRGALDSIELALA